MEKGLVLVNTGAGKGKTTAALGTAVRALGQGFKVAFLQFIKSQATGESHFLTQYREKNPDQLYYNRLGLGFVNTEPTTAERLKAAEALDDAIRLVSSGFDLVVLDEICVAMALGLIETEKVVEIIKSKPEGLSLILTGRGCPEEIIALADTVTEMTLIKHAYQQNIPALRGIEF